MACSPLDFLAEMLLAKMHVKDWSQTIIRYSTTLNLCEEGVPVACSPLEILAEMLLAEIHVRDWSQTIIRYSATISTVPPTMLP